MRHRIFIAINLPEDVKKKLSEYEIKFSDLPCRWTKKENLHITLAFLGYLSDEELVEICKITKEAALRHEPFLIKLNKIIYGPPHQSKSKLGAGQAPGSTPRMVWAEGEESEELGKLQKDLENSLAGLSSELEEEEARLSSPTAPARLRLRANSLAGGQAVGGQGRGFASHITLGRLRQWEFRQIELEERPEINEEISLSFSVESIEVMESELKRGGPEYSILETCSLGSRD